MAEQTPTVSDLSLVNEEEKARFHALMDELERTQEPDQRERILEQLAQLTFGC